MSFEMKAKKAHEDISMKAFAEGFISMRSAGKPLTQPSYSFRDVPQCARDLGGSVLQEVTDRDPFNEHMAEMVLLCNEAMRRHAKKLSQKRSRKGNLVKKTSKPLSLEYIADRIDVDDPIFGFFVRTANLDEAKQNADGQTVPASSFAVGNVPPTIVRGGMLQGFITVTTFTNWQKTFRFDSMHDSAFAFDDPNLAEDMLNGTRKYDRHGKLAEVMQATVHCGDPWNEGIVWPRIAEISLLGALGCGKALLELVIERLESSPAKKMHNYDFVVLQATDNSIPFYESMGFVRVGCITEDEQFGKTEETVETSSVDENDVQATPELAIDDSFGDASTVNQQGQSDSASKPNSALANIKETPNEVVSSEVLEYTTKQPYEKVCDIAKQFKVDVWDIIYMNKDLYQELIPSSYLMRDTKLFIPSKQGRYDATSNALHNARKFGGKSRSVQWYFSQDDESPKEIAKKFNVKCRDLVKANSNRIADLQPSSRLIENTRIQVSHLHMHNDQFVPYCHWTFPDDSFSTSEPSYMMARRLNRKKRSDAKSRPVESSFPRVTKYEPPAVSAETKSDCSGAEAPGSTKKKQKGSKKRARHPDEPVPPKRPANAFMVFCGEIRASMIGKPASEITKVASEKVRNAFHFV
uniref:Uncharacterized protein n=1 Tax=Odontella aurita TaxID=265563 RepID=A0A7S4JNY1_9STRA|mmetsp:Transcript_50492/g.152079  ORF Transcript_50492/g.152079 Transcript_50492/m.152079 type:complete len:637 (+) Transcript_50492:220-2130(+)